MKYILIADLHLSAYSNDPVIDGLPEKLTYTMNVLENIIKFGRNNGINSIIIAGDIIHTKSIIHSIAISCFLDFIRSNKDFNFIVISGNHDLSSRSGKGVTALKFLDNEPNVDMIHDTILLENKLYFVPWNPVTMIDDIKNGPENSYLISHLGLNEAQLNSGISITSEIGLKDVKQYKYCFLGHYHKSQQVGNVVYIGSPIQMDWGEKHEEKRFIVLDTESGEITSIPTEGYKKHFEFELTQENKAEVLQECEKLKKEGHCIKLNKTEDFDTSDIDDKFRVAVKVERDITNRGINSSMTTDEKITKYLEVKNIPEDSRALFKRIGIDIINRCENGKSRGL